MNRNKYLTLPALALAGALALTACGGEDTASTGSGSGESSSEHGGGHSTDSDDVASAQANAVDISFLTGMTPHHEQAVEMSEIILSKNPPAEVAEIATKIKDAQAPEIQQMEAMLSALGEDGGSGQHGSVHSGGHGGMMSEADMAAFREATRIDAAKIFLMAMIAHHQGAIEASDKQIADGQYAPAIELAKQIKQAQEAEITEMEQILAKL